MPHDKAIDAQALEEGLAPLPEAKVGDFSLTVERRARVDYFGKPVAWPYPFNVLRQGDKVWMSSTPQEVHDALEAIKACPPNAQVLMGGLGIGLVPRLLWCKGKARSVTVVERAPEVIQLVQRPLTIEAVKLNVSLGVIEDDIEAFLRKHDGAFDFIFLDVWPEGDYLYLPLVCQLTELASKHLTPGGVMRAWHGQDSMEKNLRQELRGLVKLRGDLSLMVQFPDSKWEEFKGQWPFFVPFVEWLVEQKEVPSGKVLRDRLDLEVGAFRKGEREGVHKQW